MVERPRCFQSTPAGLVYTAHPGGAPGTQFKQKPSPSGELLFENPEHDFPKRIRYTRRDDGTIQVTVDGEHDGRASVALLRQRLLLAA